MFLVHYLLILRKCLRQNNTFMSAYSAISLSCQRLFIALSLLFFLGGYEHQVQAQIYVSATATGADNGSSWIDAYTDLQDALSAATSGDTIVVARGTYKPSFDLGGSFVGAVPQATFRLPPGVTLIGGWQGNEVITPATIAVRTQADIDATILSGDVDNNGTVDANNAWHVVYTLNTGATPIVVDGFTIMEGHTGSGFDNRGAGWLNYANAGVCNLDLRRITFRDNLGNYGAGMANEANNGSSITVSFSSVRFLDNTSVDGGAFGTGMYNRSNVGTNPINLTFENCLFANNQNTSTPAGGDGGAMLNFAGNSITIDIDNCTFFGNTAARNGGAIMSTQNLNLNIRNSIFWNNTAASSGNSWYNNPGGIAETVDIDYTLISETATTALSTTGDNTNLTLGGNIIYDTDPLFTNPASGIFILQPASPAIDAGDNTALSPGNTLDLNGNPRIQGVDVDMGALERSGFVTTWFTGASNQITIPTAGGGYNYDVSWSGPTSGTLTGRTGNTTITGLTANATYTVTITGDFPQIYFNNGGDKLKIRSIEQWGDMEWRSMQVAFFGCTELVHNATDVPDFTTANLTSMREMFRDCDNLQGGNFNNWQVGTVTDFSRVFMGADSFNEPIDSWDVSQGVNFGRMFNNALSFNQPLNSWVTTNAESLQAMFLGARDFNQPLDNWDVSGVTDMASVFRDTQNFNQDLSTWDVSSVDQMNSMFSNATAFDQSLAAWDISGITVSPSMENMLDGTALSVPNYDATLIGWATQSASETAIPTGVTLGASGKQYCAAFTEHAILQADYGWTITDGGLQSPDCAPERPVGNRGIYFDGVNDFVEIPNDPNLAFNDNDAFTVSAWVKAQQQDYQIVMTQTAGGPGPQFVWYLVITANNAVQFGTNNTAVGPWHNLNTTNGIINQNEWNHITLVYDNNQKWIYLNGTEVANGSDAHSGTGDAASRIYIARGSLGNYFNGQVDEIKIFNTALTPTQVQANLTATDPAVPNLVGYWDFEDDSNLQEAQDVVGANNGDLGGTAAIQTSDPLWALRVTETTDSGIPAQGELRWAIQQANTDPDKDYIDFSISGTGTHIISPTGSIPFTQPVLIDGYSQLGSRPNTLSVGNDAIIAVEIDGSGAGDVYGLDLSAADSEVYGLSVHGFTGTTNGAAIELRASSTNSTVAGCWIGLDAAGNASANRIGISVRSDDTQVGLPTPEGRNVSSGNQYGIFVSTNPSNVTIQNNYVGVAPDGLGSRPNTIDGIRFIGSNGLIGGTTPLERNVIGNSGLSGIAFLTSGLTNNQVFGNYIGVAADATTAIGNTSSGIAFMSTDIDNIQIGGLAPGEANIIAHNANGVNIIGTAPPNSLGNSVRGNSIFGNSSIGINLGGAGIEANVPGDTDTGANNLQNFPDISAAQLSGTDLLISFLVTSATSSSTYPLEIDFYSSDGSRQGEVYLGSYTYNTPQAVATAVLPSVAASLTLGDLIVATATDAANNTSEFSAEVAVTSFTPPEMPIGNRGVYFDGIDDQIAVPETFNGLTTFTYEAWIKPQNTASGRPFQHFMGDIDDRSFFLRRSDGTLNFFMDHSLGTRVGIQSDAPVTENQWVHVAVTFDGTFIRMYINGTAQADVSADLSAVTFDPVGNLFIGGNLAEWFPGQLDEVKVWNYARSENEIRAGINDVSTTTPGLVGYWNLDDGLGTNADDLGTGNNDGTLINDPFWAFRVSDITDSGINTIQNDGSLRDAILRANNNTGQKSYIDFSISNNPTATAQIIDVVGEPLEVNQPILLDGYSAAGSEPNTTPSLTGSNAVLKVELQGSAMDPNEYILEFIGASNNSEVRGLAFNNTNPNNDRGAIFAVRPDLRITGNFFSLDASGAPAATPNGLDMVVGSTGIWVGGTAPEDRNVFGGTVNALQLSGATNARIHNNLFGVNPNDLSALPGLGTVIFLWNGANNNQIGGLATGEANLIANATNDGITQAFNAGFETNNRLRGNIMYDNIPLGIDLVGGTESVSGTTVNDPDDADTGANNLQNFPEIFNVYPVGTDLVVEFLVSSSASHSAYPLEVDFYRSDGNRQGELYIGSYTYTTAQVTETITLTGASASVTLSDALVATVTDGASNTSEFSAEVMISNPPDILLSGTAGSNFGLVELGTTETLNFLIENIGGAPLEVGNIVISGSPAFSVAPTATVLAPGDAQALTVSFRPTSQGNFTATITIFSNDPDEPAVSFTVTGTGERNFPELIAVNSLSDPIQCGGQGQLLINVLNLSATGTYYVDLQVDAPAGVVDTDLSQLSPVIYTGTTGELLIESGLSEGTIIGPRIGLLEEETGRTSILDFSDTLAFVAPPPSDARLSAMPSPISPNFSSTISLSGATSGLEYTLLNLDNRSDLYPSVFAPASGAVLEFETSLLSTSTSFTARVYDPLTNCTDTLRETSDQTSLHTVSVEVIRGISAEDSLILIELFNATDGQNWEPAWPLEEPASEWKGLEYFGGCVTRLDLSYRGLTGVIPRAILSLSCLEYLNIAGNALDFESMEMVIRERPDVEFVYAPQDPVLEPFDTVVNEGARLVLRAGVGGTANQYQWERNGQPVQVGASDSLVLDFITPEDIGQYTTTITNRIAQELTLERRPINVEVIPRLELPDSLWLVAFYQQTGADAWRTDWDLNQPIDTWYGLRFEGGELVEISLPDNALQGALPDIFDVDTVGLIDQLQVLNLSGNNFSGTLPESLAAADSLRYLDLSNNNFSGAVPEAYGRLSNLTTLWLSNNQITSLPDSIGWESLRNLFLEGNLLTELPASLSNAQNLQVINISGNPIATLPALCLPKLRELYANNMGLTALPETIASCADLEVLEVETNLLDALPESLREEARLRILKVGDNLLDFGDLEVLVGVVQEEYSYAPQPLLGEPLDTTIATGAPYTLQVLTDGEYNTYQWFKDGVSILGATSASYPIASMSGRDVGVYTCQVTNRKATELRLQRRAITLNLSCRVGQFAIESDATGTFCEGGANSATLRAPTGNFAYQWFRNGEPIFLATARSYATNQAGTYRVRLRDPNDCQVFSEPFVLQTRPVLEVRIQPDAGGTQLVGISQDSLVAFQWYLDEEPVVGARQDTLRPVASGEYFLQTTNIHGCITTSNRLFFNVTGLAQAPLSVQTRLYPNPTDGSALFLELPSEAGRLLRAFLINTLGQEVGQIQLMQAGQARFRLSGLEGLPSGTYYLHLETSEAVILKRVLLE